ncbi:MAG: ATP-binding cassette domain-containing protein [Lachnospiraceae bacterium]
MEKFPDGLDTIVGENGKNLSGGQKQRIAIARALIHRRSVLLVDEGTSALDKDNARTIENCLLKNPNLTLVLISHNLDEEQREKFDHIYDLGKLCKC